MSGYTRSELIKYRQYARAKHMPDTFKHVSELAEKNKWQEVTETLRSLAGYMEGLDSSVNKERLNRKKKVKV
ncbi:MAG: hypothetical protein K2Y22_04330 [Candidatus Obscuribacterales bacterium]|nr:hypothetical protein [Candidatus Obscuribacterales bacterium]